MIGEVKINKSNKTLMFVNNNIAYSQMGVADEILNLVESLLKEVEVAKANKEAIYSSLLEEEDDRICYQLENSKLKNTLGEIRKFVKENSWYDYRDNEEVITISSAKLRELLGEDDDL